MADAPAFRSGLYIIPSCDFKCKTRGRAYLLLPFLIVRSTIARFSGMMTEISPTELKQIELQLLKKFADFCQRHGLRYILAFGTMLGAVRHKGFIPWDDDVDVAMPYPDYLRFLELFERENTDATTDVLYGGKNGYTLTFGKLVDTTTECQDIHNGKSYGYGAWIDIFPSFALSDDDAEAHAQILKIHRLWNLYVICSRETSFKEKPFKFLLKKLFVPLLRSYPYKATEKEALRIPYGSTKRIHSISIMNPNPILDFTYPSLFDKTFLCPFEDGLYPVPEEYDMFLTIKYGPTYMTPPPPEKRTSTHTVRFVRKA